MSNTLTVLAPTLFSAAQEVSQEPSMALDSINLDFDDKGVAIGDEVTLPVAQAGTEGDYTAAMTTTAGTDNIAKDVSVSIDFNKDVSWNLTGEQQRSLQNGSSDKEWVRQMIAQGMRTLRNAAEGRLCAEIYKGASRAYGTAGTTPFGSDINDIAAVRKILLDNGAPMSDMALIMDSAAGFNAQKLAIIQQAQAAGGDTERRNGTFGKQFGFNLGVSAGIASHTAGTATGFDTDAAEPVGETDIICADSNSGTILAGDIVTNDTNLDLGTDLSKYVVRSGGTLTAAATGTFYLNRPGIEVVTGIADEFSIGSDYTANVAFERTAVVGAMRPPIIPASPLINQMLISDAKGMTYLLCEIVGDGMITWRLQIAYGFKAVQPEHIAILIG